MIKRQHQHHDKLNINTNIGNNNNNSNQQQQQQQNSHLETNFSNSKNQKLDDKNGSSSLLTPTGINNNNGNNNVIIGYLSSFNTSNLKKYLAVFFISIVVFVIFNRPSQKSSDKDIIIISKSYDDNSVSKLDELSENTDQSIIVNDDIDSKDYYPKHQFNNTSTDDNNNGDSELINNEDELNSKMEEINVAIKASQDPNAPNAPGAVIVEELGGLLFLDGLSYEQAPFIKVPPPIGSTKAAYKGTWSLLKEHEDYFRTERPHRDRKSVV